MVKNKLFYTVLVCLLILSTAVSAYYTVEMGEYHTSTESITREEFVFHEGRYIACGGETKIIPIWIKNKQNTKHFTFKLENIDFAELSGTGFMLNPDQEGILFITIKPTLEIDGNATFNLDIFTNNELTLEPPIELDVDKCYEVSIDIKKEEDDICALELNEYVVEVENKGKSDEYFNVYLDAPDFVYFGKEFIEGINKTAQITEKSILVGLDGKTNLKMSVNQSDDVSGIFNISVYAELERGEDIKDYDYIVLDIYSKEDCYKPAINVRNVKVYGRYFHPITIKNTGIKQVTYSLGIDAPEWVVLDTKTLSLAPNQEKKIYLNINPTAEAEANAYQIKLTLSTDELEYTKLFVVKVSGKNKLIESIKQFLNYYRHYIYSAIAAVIIIFFLLAVVKRKLSEKKLKKVEKVKPKKADKPKVVRAKVITKKQAKERAKKLKELRRIFSFVYIAGSIILLLGLIGYALFKFFSPLKSSLIRYLGLIKSYLIKYGNYIFVGVGALVALILLVIVIKKFSKKIKFRIRIPKKRKTKKAKKQKVVKSKKIAKKQARKSIKFSKGTKKILKKLAVIVISLVILAGIIYSLVHFNILNMIKDFVIIYLYYIITGFVILVIFILFLMYSKQVKEFFSKDK